MANVNLKTKKIYGCKKGTKTYYHEQAHLLFEDNAPRGNLIRQWQGLSITSLIYILFFNMLLPHTLFKWLGIICVLISIGTEFFEEMWCWAYADFKMGEKRDVERIKTR